MWCQNSVCKRCDNLQKPSGRKVQWQSVVILCKAMQIENSVVKSRNVSPSIDFSKIDVETSSCPLETTSLWLRPYREGAGLSPGLMGLLRGAPPSPKQWQDLCLGPRTENIGRRAQHMLLGSGSQKIGRWTKQHLFPGPGNLKKWPLSLETREDKIVKNS